jgi:hypothetical protein
MEKILAAQTPPMALVRQVLLEEIAESLGMRLVDMELPALLAAAPA